MKIKLNKLKSDLKLCGMVVEYTTYFWGIETAIFLIIEGWHWEATHLVEIGLDHGVSIGFGVGFLLFLRSIWKAMSYMVDVIIEEAKEIK